MRLLSIRIVKPLVAAALAAALLVSSCGPSLAAPAPAVADLVDEFMTVADQYYDSVRYSSNHYHYTEAEVKMLAIVIHLEARGEPYRCKLAIGNVVMNRVLSPGYPGSTIKAVVTAPHQFCYRASVKPSAECVRAARDVLENEVWVVPQNTYFFKVYRSKANWGSHTFYARIGSTAFYRHKYAGRYTGSSVPAALYERVYKWPQYGCKPGLGVRKLQAMLKSFGYDVGVDGYFGEDTKEALKQFQKSCGIASDGVAGPSTLSKLIRKYGIGNYQKL